MKSKLLCCLLALLFGLSCHAQEVLPVPVDVQLEAPPLLEAAELPVPQDGMAIPMLFQYDYAETVCYMNGKNRSVATSGCGATAASMVIAYVNGDYDQNPHSLFSAAVENGMYHGNGLDYPSIQTMLTNHDVSAEMESVSQENIESALRAERPIIINMGPGAFTRSGHYIVLRGLNDVGRVLVNDPGSANRSAGSYTISHIVSEAKTDLMLVVGEGEMPIVTDEPKK